MEPQLPSDQVDLSVTRSSGLEKNGCPPHVGITDGKGDAGRSIVQEIRLSCSTLSIGELRHRLAIFALLRLSYKPPKA